VGGRELMTRVRFWSPDGTGFTDTDGSQVITREYPSREQAEAAIRLAGDKLDLIGIITHET
jgi:hypothetical protein